MTAEKVFCHKWTEFTCVVKSHLVKEEEESERRKKRSEFAVSPISTREEKNKSTKKKHEIKNKELGRICVYYLF